MTMIWSPRPRLSLNEPVCSAYGAPPSPPFRCPPPRSSPSEKEKNMPATNLEMSRCILYLVDDKEGVVLFYIMNFALEYQNIYYIQHTTTWSDHEGAQFYQARSRRRLNDGL
jgi:hypothetical protein